MKRKDHTTADEAARRKARARVAIHLQAMEGNPFTAEDEAMFEMFEREGLSFERRREYMIAKIKRRRVPNAAE